MAPTLGYEAVAKDGSLVQGELDVAHERELDEELSRRDLALVRLLHGDRLSGARSASRGRLRPVELAELAGYVAITTRAGLSVVDALADFGVQCRAPASRQVLEAVVSEVRNGSTLGDAFAQHPRSFPPMFLSMVRAGEEVGALDEAMDNAARQLHFQADVRSQIRGAMVQPAILLASVSGLVTLLITFLLPRLVGMLGSAGVELPAPTAFLLSISDVVRSQWPWLGAAAVLATLAGWQTMRRPGGRRAVGRALLYVPVLGEMLWMGAQARFVSAMSTLLASGVGALRALDMAAATAGQPLMQAQLGRVAERVGTGETLATALDSVDRLHPLVLRMVHLGETAGRLDESLGTAVDFFAAELPRRIHKAVALLQPAIVVGSGLLVAFILLSALLPVFSLYEAL